MAITRTIICRVCGQEKSIIERSGEFKSKCRDCEEKELHAELREFLDSRKALSEEQRLEKLEEDIFWLKKEIVEAKNPNPVFG